MAKTVTINGVTYANVPSVQIPLSTGQGNATFYETSGATASAEHVMQGYKAYGASGEVTGTLTTPAVSQDATTKVLTVQ